MKIVLDTSVLISESVRDDLGTPMTVASITYAELRFGASRPGLSGAERAIRELRLRRIMAQFGGGLPFDDAAAVSYGTLTALVEGAGRQVRGRRFDLLIAAVAHANGAGIVTENGGELAALKAVMPVLTPAGVSW